MQQLGGPYRANVVCCLLEKVGLAEPNDTGAATNTVWVCVNLLWIKSPRMTVRSALVRVFNFPLVLVVRQSTDMYNIGCRS